MAASEPSKLPLVDLRGLRGVQLTLECSFSTQDSLPQATYVHPPQGPH